MSTPAGRSVVVEREFQHPPAKIWRALTEGSLLKEWLMDNDFQPVAGHRFNFRAKPMPQWDGIIGSEVQVVEAGKKLSYTWNALGLLSVVTWTLTETKSGTLLRMEHSGFRPDQEAAFKGATYGWQSFICNLERTLAGLN